MTDPYVRLLALWLASHHPQAVTPEDTHLLAQSYHEFLAASPDLQEGQCVPNPFFPCPHSEEEGV